MMDLQLSKKDITRFFSKIIIGRITDCWYWNAAKDPNGYGRIGIQGKTYLPHRISWYFFNKELDKDICVCHTCDNPSCVNPTHLFLGTRDDNNKDCKDKGRNSNGNVIKTHCKNGHEFNKENTYYRISNNSKYCKVCRRKP